jgi:hypothetical protein
LKEHGFEKFKGNEKEILAILKSGGATQTEAVITVHLGLNATLDEAEGAIYPSGVWKPESLQDIAFQTFLYMNYNPGDPDFYADENTVRFALFRDSPKKDAEEKNEPKGKSDSKNQQ